ncbi:MAG TPA: RNA polymerase sigma factor, partial [Bacteroidetes bacterium]|nr:RNA polymerase sigma factor [Bacteroidota bacterium]
LEGNKYKPESPDNGYSDLKEVLDKAVEQLPEIQRSVVLLRDYEGYSYREIGQITGLSESQVKVYIFRARLFLKKFIGKPEVVL